MTYMHVNLHNNYVNDGLSSQACANYVVGVRVISL